MSKELVISANRHETRVALIEDDQLVEVYFQRANEYSLAGSIHKGRVTRVLPGMQSAFVDLGLERDTFLYVSDFLEEHEDFDRVTGDERPSRHERGPDRERDRRPPPPPQQAPVVVSPSDETNPSAPPAEALAGGPAPATDRPADRPPDRPSDERERRGRRSRRRRNRGRGFPDSKYASEPGAHTPVQTEPELLAESESVAAPSAPSFLDERIPLILPGESLKKYKGESAGETLVEPPPLPVHTPVDVEDEFDEPIHYPPE